MIAWLAPGQGAERPGMGRCLRSWPEAAALLDLLEPGLHGTDRVQPALVATALGTAAALTELGVRCDVVAGHSVGELAAWSLAGGATAEEALDLARVRGRAMAEAAAQCPGGMWALDALPSPMPEGLVLAVHNPGQWVLSGPGPAPPGARPVPVSGPWHSPAMGAAAPALTEALARIPARTLQLPLISNHDGAVVREDAVVRAHLVQQLTHPVRWTRCLQTLGELGCTDVVLLGPGRSLAAGLRAVLPGVRVHRTEREADLRETARALLDSS